MEQLNEAVSKKAISHFRKHYQHCGGAFHLSKASSFYDMLIFIRDIKLHSRICKR